VPCAKDKWSCSSSRAYRFLRPRCMHLHIRRKQLASYFSATVSIRSAATTWVSTYSWSPIRVRHSWGHFRGGSLDHFVGWLILTKQKKVKVLQSIYDHSCWYSSLCLWPLSPQVYGVNHKVCWRMASATPDLRLPS